MKINFFNNHSPLYPFRWFIIILVSISIFMLYADESGWRLFSFGSNQQQWSASGPGYHK